jgi:sterol 14-demethylase
MSFAAHLNGTLPFSDAWSDYLAQAQAYFPVSNLRLALVLLINTPVIVILLNVLQQLVSFRISIFARL